MVAIAVWIALWYRRTTPAEEAPPLERKRPYGTLALGMLLVAAATGFVRAMILTGVPRTIDGADRFLAWFGVTSMAVAFWEFFVYSLVTTASHTRFAAKSHLRT
jgi:hypothetical protein